MRIFWMGLLAAGALVLAPMAGAQSADQQPLRIGLITDLSGSGIANFGPGSVEGAKLAIADAGGSVLGRPIELLTYDPQFKVDNGIATAKKWYDEDHVAALFDLPGSAMALGIASVTRERNKIALISGSLTSDLTGKACTPNTFQWGLDTYSLPHALLPSIFAQGKRKFFIISADYAFGVSMEQNASSIIKSLGGTVSSVRHPYPTTSQDFSSYILSAQSSGADTILLTNGDSDLVNTIKTAHEFGVGTGDSKQQIAVLTMMISGVKSVGREIMQGTSLIDSFYWDMNDQTRGFAKRFAADMHAMPSSFQAEVYSSVNHYLKAVKAAGTDDSQAVIAKMRELPVNDFMTHGAKIREDGRLMRNLYLFKVKSPSEAKGGDWDLLKLVATVPAEKAFRPLAEGDCPLVEK